jgi:hypothetical protein
MNKTDQLISVLGERFKTTFDSKYNNTDSLVLGYLRGLLGVLEQSDDKLARALEYHIQDNRKD